MQSSGAHRCLPGPPDTWPGSSRAQAALVAASPCSREAFPCPSCFGSRAAGARAGTCQAAGAAASPPAVRLLPLLGLYLRYLLRLCSVAALALLGRDGFCGRGSLWAPCRHSTGQTHPGPPTSQPHALSAKGCGPLSISWSRAATEAPLLTTARALLGGDGWENPGRHLMAPGHKDPPSSAVPQTQIPSKGGREQGAGNTWGFEH